jgi:cytidylate kinase
MIRIVTLDREFAAGGAEVAAGLARRLGWKLWDNLLTKEVARCMPCDASELEDLQEKRDPLFYRLMKSFMRGTYEGDQRALESRLLDADAIFAATRRVISQAAQEGRCVIVGRGAAHFLRDRADACHVFVYAPPEDKARRLRDQGHGESEAAELAATVDGERAAFIKSYFGIDWPFRSEYDLMVSTRHGAGAAVETIMAGIAALEKTAPGRR